MTNKSSVYRPRTDGMGSIEDESWGFSLLVMMDESLFDAFLMKSWGQSISVS